jgi:hypothetical protein
MEPIFGIVDAIQLESVYGFVDAIQQLSFQRVIK